MHAMWIRCPFTSNCSLSYGENKNSLNQDAAVNIIRFRSGIRTLYTHQATMQNLKADTKYCKSKFLSHNHLNNIEYFIFFIIDYRITCEQNSTKVFDFKTLPVDPEKVPTTIIGTYLVLVELIILSIFFLQSQLAI